MTSNGENIKLSRDIIQMKSNAISHDWIPFNYMHRSIVKNDLKKP